MREAFLQTLNPLTGLRDATYPVDRLWAELELTALTPVILLVSEYMSASTSRYSSPAAETHRALN